MIKMDKQIIKELRQIKYLLALLIGVIIGGIIYSIW